MLKLTVVVLGVALAGTASGAGWRSLSVDGSSAAAFKASVAALQEKLPRVRRLVLEKSLQDIWAEGLKAAQAVQGEYTLSDHQRRLDGLGYKEIVTFTDPSGDTARRYFDDFYRRVAGAGPPRPTPQAIQPRPQQSYSPNSPPNPNRY